MSVIDMVIFLAYLLSSLGIGLYFMQKSKTADDYMVANRSLGTSVFIATMVATSVGGGSTMGYVATTVKGAFLLVPSEIVFFIIQIFIALFFAERLRHFAGRTAPDLLGRTYGKWAQAIGGIESFIYMLGTGPAMQAIALGSIIHIMTGWSLIWGAALAMAIIVAYTWASGLWGVAMTDFMQFIVMSIGLSILAIMGFNKAGGWEGIVTIAPEGYFNIKTNIPTMIQLTLALSIPTLIDGNRYQRFYAARDKRVAKRGYLLAIIPWYLLFIVTIVIGMVAMALVPEAKGDTALPALIVKILPPGIIGILCAALVAAIMSTADSYLLVGATNFANDIYKTLIKPDATDGEIVRVTRLCVVVEGILGLLLAFYIPSIMGLWNLASAAYVSGCVVPMMVALFRPGRKSSAPALGAMIAGGGIGVYLEMAKIKLFGQPPILIGVMISLLTLIILQSITKKSANANRFNIER